MQTRDLKVVIIEAQFPELKGGACNQRGKGTGTSVRAAAARAFTDLLRQKKLKHKRFTRLTAVISVGTVRAIPEDPIADRDSS
jgi:hypothetical protein